MFDPLEAVKNIRREVVLLLVLSNFGIRDTEPLYTGGDSQVMIIYCNFKTLRKRCLNQRRVPKGGQN